MMKKTILLFLMSAALFGCTTPQGGDDQKSVEKEVEFMRKALISGNEQDLKMLAADDLTYGHSSGKVQNKEEFVSTIVSGASDFVNITYTQQQIKVNGDVAWVRHLLSADTNDSGKPGHVNLGILLVFKKYNGQWKLFARQAYKI